MYATIPIYYPSLEEAERNDEKELWLESYKINMDCGQDGNCYDCPRA